MNSITTQSDASAAEALREKIVRDKRMIEALIAGYFAVPGTFPCAGDVALGLQDVVASMDDTLGEIGHRIRMFDEDPHRTEYA